MESKPSLFTIALHIAVSAVGFGAVVWESIRAERRRQRQLARVVAEVRADTVEPQYCPCGIISGAYGRCRKCTGVGVN